MATAPMKLYTRTRVLLFDTSENTEVESFHIRIDLNNHLFFCLCLSVTSLMRLRKKETCRQCAHSLCQWHVYAVFFLLQLARLP